MPCELQRTIVNYRELSGEIESETRVKPAAILAASAGIDNDESTAPTALLFVSSEPEQNRT